MKYQKMSKAVNIVLVIYSILGLFSVFCCYPFLTGIYSGRFDGLNVTQFVLEAILAVPCFLFLVVAFQTSFRVKRGGIYSVDFSKLKLWSLVLLIDAVIFALTNLTFNIIKYLVSSNNVEAFFSSAEAILFLVGVAGMTIGLIIYYICHIMLEAKDYKEDSEAIV